MFRLRDLKNGLYEIHSSKHTEGYEGTINRIFNQAVYMGVVETELSKALYLLQTKGHKVADFGTKGNLLRTKPE